MASLVKMMRSSGYGVQIWADVDETGESQDHFYIKRTDEAYASHYFHWDALLSWHATDIIMASYVIVK